MANRLTLAAVQDLISDLTKTMKDEIKMLRDEVASLKAELSIVNSKLSSVNADSTAPSIDAPTFADVVSSTVAPLLRKSVQSALNEEQAKNEVIIGRAEENGNDQNAVMNLCQKLDFQSTPKEIKRLGKKTDDNHSRLLKVSFAHQFDARTFCARFEEKRRAKDDIPNWRVRISRTKEEQAAFIKKNNVVFKLNEDAKAAKLNESYSLRNDGSVWKFVKQPDSSWKRDSEWSLKNSGNSQ